MKHHSVVLSALFLAGSLGLIAPAVAISGPSGSTNEHSKAPMNHMGFNSSTIETIHGEVTEVMQPKAEKGWASEVRLDLKTKHGTMPVVLAPTSYLDKEKVKINKGENISVTGSRITMDKRTELIATEVRIGKEKIDLRKSDGTPLWATKEH